MTEDLELNETEDGLVIYQEKTDTVHHLNHTAALVLLLCDGTRDEEAIVDVVSRGYELDERPAETIRSCLADLRWRGLIS